MCGFAEDADMKIVGAEPTAGADATETWLAHKNCGNIDRAHRLGAVMAQQLLGIDEEDPALLLQKQTLFAFAVDAGCALFLPDDLLAQTARATFSERLRSLLPSFEETVHRLGAFTFYRLCLDDTAKGQLPAERIGTVYAALCGKAEDGKTEAAGTALFRQYLEKLEETVAMITFREIS